MNAVAQTQIFDVDDAHFEEAVIGGSQERVIVVDFWAPWCGPCRTLGPILEEVVTALGPNIALAKVNVDDNPQLAQAFRVQGIPAVKIVHRGKLVQEFTGALPKEQVEKLLRPLVPDAPAAEEEEDLLEQAHTLMDSGAYDSAARVYEQHLEARPDDDQAQLGLARVRLYQGSFEETRERVGKIEQGTPAYDQAQALLTHIEFHRICAEAGGRQACAQKRRTDPDNLEARYTLACCAAVEGDYQTALEEWFAIVERQKNFRQGAARDAMVSIFLLLGRHSQIVGDYPQRLYRILN